MLCGAVIKILLASSAPTMPFPSPRVTYLFSAQSCNCIPAVQREVSALGGERECYCKERWGGYSLLL